MRGVEIGEEYFPGKNVTTDEQIHETVKKIFNTQYHACATNKMGKEDDEYAVVDPKGRVYGVENREFYQSFSIRRGAVLMVSNCSSRCRCLDIPLPAAWPADGHSL